MGDLGNCCRGLRYGLILLETIMSIALPFKCMILDTEPVLVKNRFSGEGIMLTPEAVAVYDSIIGAEMIGSYDIVRKGIDWFRDHFPEAYMVLLD